MGVLQLVPLVIKGLGGRHMLAYEFPLCVRVRACVRVYRALMNGFRMVYMTCTHTYSHTCTCTHVHTL